MPVINGTTNNDTIAAGQTGGDDTIYALAGNDDITDSGGSSNLIYAGAGNDFVDLFGSGNTVVGGNGLDTVSGSDNDDSIAGGLGDDSLIGAIGADTLMGGAGNDWLDGGTGDADYVSYADATSGIYLQLSIGLLSIITQGSGNDTLGGFENATGSAFDDTMISALSTGSIMFGGAGRDGIHGAAGADLLVGQAGTDIISGNGGDDFVHGGTENDTLSGGAGADFVDGEEGNDHVSSVTSGDDLAYDQLVGGDGLDLVSYFNAASAVYVDLRTNGTQSTSGGGDDDLSGFELVEGSAFADQLSGTTGAETLLGGDGDDALYTRGGLDDSLNGGAGANDWAYFYETGVALVVDMNAGTATGTGVQVNFGGIEGVYTDIGADSVTGSGGADRVYGAGGNDTIRGGVGADSLNGGTGSNLVVGGEGADTISFDGSDAVSEFLFNTADGDVGDDLLTGGYGDDFLVGSGDNDTLRGNQGDDTLTGGDGQDVLDGAFLDSNGGSAGVDLASYGGAGAAVTVSLAQNGFQDTGGAGLDKLIGIERVRGSAFADQLTGDEGSNRLWGGDGGDVLSGGKGFDALFGEAGDDTLAGGADTDSLIGGDGVDTVTYAAAKAAVTVAVNGVGDTGGDGYDSLIEIENVTGSRFADTLTGDNKANVLRGGDGNDSLSGGKGGDRLEGGLGGDDLSGGGGADNFVFSAIEDKIDRILDLTNDDRINLSAIDANANAGGNNAFVLVNNFTGAGGEIRLVYSATKDQTTLQLDTDGDKKANMSIVIDGDHDDFTNFVL